MVKAGEVEGGGQAGRVVRSIGGEVMTGNDVGAAGARGGDIIGMAEVVEEGWEDGGVLL